jgi:hypothetical protein
MVKKEGGSIHSNRLIELFRQKRVGFMELEYILKDLEDMGLIRLTLKSKDGVFGYLAVLI